MLPFKAPKTEWVESLEKAENEGDERPTWAYDWPAGTKLAEDLQDLLPKPIGEINLADIGCGKGNSGVQAALLGVRQADFYDKSIYPLKYLDKLISENNLSNAKTAQHTWGDALGMAPANGYDIIVGGDILYRPECFNDLFKTIATSLSESGKAFLSDPRINLENNILDLLEEQDLSVNIKRQKNNYTLLTISRT